MTITCHFQKPLTYISYLPCIYLWGIDGVMKTLNQYLKESGVRQADFADRVNTTQAHISRLCAEGATRSPSVDLAKRIEAETDGAVPAWVWPAFEQFAPAQSAGAA